MNDSSREFPFAAQPPNWDTITLSTNDEEPFGEQDKVPSKANPVMLCEEMKCIVLLGSDWTLIWCPICGANCVDDPEEPTYFAGMAGLRAHITKSHKGICSGGNQKFIVDHGGSQSLGEDELADVRARRLRPQFRAAFRADFTAQQAESNAEEASSDDGTANDALEERVSRARERPPLKQDVARSSQEHEGDDLEDVEEREPTPLMQHNALAEPGTRPTHSTRSTRRVMDTPHRSANTSESLDEEPVSATQKRERRRKQSAKVPEFGEGHAEGVKRRSKSRGPGSYKEPRKNRFEWEAQQEGGSQ